MLAPLFAFALLVAPVAKPAPATNTACPVLGGKVGETSKTVVVRDRTYRLCCAGCDTKLLKDPDMYLSKDGMPRNAKR